MGKSTKKNITTKAAPKAVPSVSPKLTPKQKKFCRSIAKGKNATQAAIDAGYSKHTAREIGCENLTKPYIVQEIDKATKKIQEKLDYKDFQHFAELGRIGQLAENRGDLATALKALVQQGKLCGLYVDRVKTEISGSISSFSVNQFLEKFNAEK